MKNIKRFLCVLLAFVMMFSTAACSSESDEKGESKFETVELEKESEEAQKTEEEETVEEIVIPTLPEHMNPLTGLSCDASLVGQRPIGVMFNNIKDALPQIGLGKCDIIYEVLAEGGITRLEGLIFDYASVENLGSIRSARPYYVNIARAYDAVYIHAGGSEPAYSLIASTKIDHFDGVRGNFSIGSGNLFWRDQGRLKNGYSTEHTMFTKGSDVAIAIEQRKIRTQLKDPSFAAFSFDPAFEAIGNGSTATYIKVPHSTYYISEFQYDPATGLYAHSHYGTKHIDGGTGEQITAKNVFILYTNQRVVDSYGRREVTLTGEGSGFYFNGGECVEIVWKRDSDDTAFKYYNTDGSELSVQQGKSYISLVDVKTKGDVTIS